MPGGLHPPISVIESWPKANYVNPELRGWLVPTVNIVLFSLALIMASLRLFARFFLLRSAGLDDYLIALSLIPLLGLTISLSLVKMYNYDRHIWDVPLTEATATRKILFAIEILYITSTGLTKLSVLLFYKRLSNGGISPSLKRVAQASIAFVAFTTLFFTIFPFLSCSPFSAFFDQVNPFWFYTHLKPGEWKCLDELTHFYANGSISIVQDFIAVGLPLALFHSLQLPRRQKVLLGAVFFVGFCVCIIGILRLVSITKLYTDTYDLTWESQRVWLWTGAEANVAVICACLPCCRVYARRYLNYSMRSWSVTRTPDRVVPSFVKAGWSVSSSSGIVSAPSRKASVGTGFRKYEELGTAGWNDDRAGGPGRSQSTVVGRGDEEQAHVGPGIRVNEDVIFTVSRTGEMRSPGTSTAVTTIRVPSVAHTVDSFEMHDWDRRTERDR